MVPGTSHVWEEVTSPPPQYDDGLGPQSVPPMLLHLHAPLKAELVWAPAPDIRAFVSGTQTRKRSSAVSGDRRLLFGLEAVKIWLPGPNALSSNCMSARGARRPTSCTCRNRPRSSRCGTDSGTD